MLKRFFCLLIAAVIGLAVLSCTDADNKPEASAKANKVTSWTMHGFEKTKVNVAPKGDFFTTEYTVYAAKGETEGCQVAVYSKERIAKTYLAPASGNPDVIKVSLYSMNRTHKVGGRYYTDSLIPYYGRKLALEEGTILPFMIEFTTTESTPAGEYKYVYEFKDENETVLATFNITLCVWDFTIPKEKTFATAMGLSKGWLESTSNAPDAFATWYDIHLEHNMTGYSLPYDILDDRADAYMSDPRVTSFRVPHTSNNIEEVDEELILRYYKKLKTNPVWLSKAYFYPLDEPHTLDMLNMLKAWEKKLTELCPDIEIIAPYYTNLQLGEENDQTEFMEEFTDLWCPKLWFWNDEISYGKFLDYTPEKTFQQRMLERQAEGDRVWTYVANNPDDPYAQMFLDTEGVNQRLMFWQMYQRDIEGFLYWGTNYYGYEDGKMRNPWNNVNTGVTSGGRTIYGCGFLFYPGYYVGVPGCVPSIRAKIVRDGIDDIEMFYLAEKVLGKEWLVAKTYEGTASLTEFTDGDGFIKLRIEIGNALEEKLKG